MEQPNAWVVHDDTKGCGPHGFDLDGVSTDGVGLSFNDGRVESRIVGGVVRGTSDDTELVTVKMARRSTVSPSVQRRERRMMLTKDACQHHRS